jgi:RNA-directed DNA polymerase
VLTSKGLGSVPDSGLRRLLYHWPRIWEQLLQGAYQPQPLKRVKIPKPGGGERPLGIPTVLGKLTRGCVVV